MTLTRIPIELVQGNGFPNMLVTNTGDGLDVGTVTADPGITITDIAYDYESGIMKIYLSNGETIILKGFVKAMDLRRGRNGRPGLTGLNGLNGLNGLDGMKGERGPVGFRGLRGRRGAPGPKGIDGPTGEQGYPGERGDQGQIGPKGKYGQVGEKGEKGDHGRDSFLPIIISEGDPGAIGAGSIWVKPSEFKLGDPVRFTTSGTIEDDVCNDTLAMLTAVSNNDNATDWWYVRNVSNVLFDTFEYEYQDSFVYDNSLYLIVRLNSLFGKTTCIVNEGKIVNLQKELSNPLCFVDSAIYVLCDKKLFIVTDTVNEYEIDVTKINAFVKKENLLYIASDYGFYTFNLNQKKLYKHYSEKCSNVYVNDYVNIVVDNITIVTNLSDYEAYVDHEYMGDIYVSFDGGVSAFSNNSLLWFNPMLERAKHNLARIGNNYYQMTAIGPKYIMTTPMNLIVKSNFIIEYDETSIYITQMV